MGTPGLEMQCDSNHEPELFQNATFLYGKSGYFMSLEKNPEKTIIDMESSEGNLSWLLNYKIHELPPVPDVSAENEDLFANVNVGHYEGTSFQEYGESMTLTCDSMLFARNQFEVDPLSDKPVNSALKKPPFTYTELIEYALCEKGELTVSGIYQWISDHFPFYKQNDDRWKNSVRHNLSINPHFRKGGKAIHGAGHLWTIAQKESKKSIQTRQRMKDFIESVSKNSRSKEEEFDKEVLAATASILESENLYSPCDNGNKGLIEIQFLDFVEVDNDLKEFLTPPISKQQIVHECGLGNEHTILDTGAVNPLDLNAKEQEIVYDGHFYDATTFEYYELEKK